ncbi:hypothetical protein SAG0136_04190 [Streptococcus agalactiae LMG 14747]|uniref:Uncharacterized protein n=1 Tax=Streptococcus agalactiae LMG 14747 TaxID=1154860 RepID=V6Z0R3_STRAG|nr:DUF6710 family protein [Streptococcus parasuis]ESV54462.1 hypothetical protein SAG0136_04190 [Streptococcus agalactiae LMG 14747]WDN59241.1 hypothetical protein LOD77_04110 [Streptococcus parasuis]HEM6128843.1 hypothetical protein [Streptococcus suis]
MIDSLSKFIGSFFREEKQNDDYTNRFHWYLKQLESGGDTNKKIETVKNILAVIVNYLNFDEAIQSFEIEGGPQDNSNIERIYDALAYEANVIINMSVYRNIHPDDVKYYKGCAINGDGPISLQVNELPILLNPWHPKRVIDNLSSINDQNIFDGKQYNYNIENNYLYPMDIVVCHGANHSQFAARIHHQGHTIIKQSRDYSPLYEYIYFDGMSFKKIIDDSEIDIKFDEKLVFYAGVIFECGRTLLECSYKRFE